MAKPQPVTLYAPKTGRKHTFKSERAASVFERKGWTKTAPKKSSGQKQEA